MSSVKSRIAALENVIVLREGEVSRIQALEDEAIDDWNAYLDWIERVWLALDEKHYRLIYPEFEAASDDQLDLRGYGESRSNGLSTLANAVLSLAAVKHAGREIPHIIPPALAEYFAGLPSGHFDRSPEVPANERVGDWWKVWRPHWLWLSGDVSCVDCALPVPTMLIGRDSVNEARKGRGEPEKLPFKKCPACSGKVEWSVNHK